MALRTSVEALGASGTVTINSSLSGKTIPLPTVFNNVAIGGFSFRSSYRFGLGARTSGATERALAENVQIARR